jgi:hypothetical protein
MNDWSSWAQPRIFLRLNLRDQASASRGLVPVDKCGAGGGVLIKRYAPEC